MLIKAHLDARETGLADLAAVVLLVELGDRHAAVRVAVLALDDEGELGGRVQSHGDDRVQTRALTMGYKELMLGRYGRLNVQSEVEVATAEVTHLSTTELPLENGDLTLVELV